jgi:PAS domain S-box-containing protein
LTFAAAWKRLRSVERGPSAAASALAQSTILGELLERANVGVLAIDEGHYVAANEYACVLLGYARNELIGCRVAEVRWFSDLPAQFLAMRRAQRQGGELRLTRNDGSPLDIEYRVVESDLTGLPILVGLFWPA